MNVTQSEYSFSALAAGKWAVALVIATWLQIPGAIQALLVFMGIDLAVGLLVAWQKHVVSSAEMGSGIIRKVLLLVLIMTAHLAEKTLGLGVGIANIAAVGYSINELISITENCARAGVPIPAALVTVLLAAKRLRSKSANEQELRELQDAGDEKDKAREASGGAS